MRQWGHMSKQTLFFSQVSLRLDEEQSSVWTAKVSLAPSASGVSRLVPISVSTNTIPSPAARGGVQSSAPTAPSPVLSNLCSPSTWKEERAARRRKSCSRISSSPRVRVAPAAASQPVRSALPATWTNRPHVSSSTQTAGYHPGRSEALIRPRMT